jgi:aryl-alcohol dehydrogenase-like predicted oxidoreductase
MTLDRVAFGTTDLEVSTVCLGAMNFGAPDWGCDAEAAAEIVHVYRDAGGNCFDTADFYARGESERILGRLLAGAHDDVVVASKVGFAAPGRAGAGLAPAHVRVSLEATLTRLGMDHLDLYQLHAFDPAVPLEDTLGAMQELVEAGLVRYVGCSNFFVWQLAYADAVARDESRARLVSAQMMYNLVRRDLEREHLAHARRTGLALTAYSPLHGGHLAGAWRSRADLPPDSRAASNPDVYLDDEARLFSVVDALVGHAERIGATPGQVALAWVVRNPGITTTITAARSAAELREQLGALTLDADDAFWASLDAATALPPSYPADFYRRLEARNRS